MKGTPDQGQGTDPQEQLPDDLETPEIRMVVLLMVPLCEEWMKYDL